MTKTTASARPEKKTGLVSAAKLDSCREAWDASFQFSGAMVSFLQQPLSPSSKAFVPQHRSHVRHHLSLVSHTETENVASPRAHVSNRGSRLNADRVVPIDGQSWLVSTPPGWISSRLFLSPTLPRNAQHAWICTVVHGAQDCLHRKSQDVIPRSGMLSLESTAHAGTPRCIDLHLHHHPSGSSRHMHPSKISPAKRQPHPRLLTSSLLCIGTGGVRGIDGRSRVRLLCASNLSLSSTPPPLIALRKTRNPPWRKPYTAILGPVWIFHETGHDRTGPRPSSSCSAAPQSARTCPYSPNLSPSPPSILVSGMEGPTCQPFRPCPGLGGRGIYLHSQHPSRGCPALPCPCLSPQQRLR